MVSVLRPLRMRNHRRREGSRMIQGKCLRLSGIRTLCVNSWRQSHVMAASSLRLWGLAQRKSLILQCVDSHLMRQRTSEVT